MRRVGLPAVFRGCPTGGWFDPGRPIPDFWAGRGRWSPGEALHMFVDDYRQEFVWRRPVEGLLVAVAAGVVTAPDYTVWTNDPPEWAAWQVWRSAVVAGYWGAHGVEVIPVLTFGGSPGRYVAPGSTWAIRAPAVGDETAWRERLVAVLDEVGAGRLLVFGRRLELDLPIPVVWRRLRSVNGRA